MIEELALWDDVARIIPDFKVHLPDEPAAREQISAESIAWGVEKINAPDVWAQYNGTGINTSSGNMTVNDVQVLLSNTSSGFTFNFTNTTPAAYNHGDTVNVTFNVSDNEGHMNSTTFTSSTPGFSPFTISGEPVSISPVISTDDRTHVDIATNDSNMTSSSQTNVSEPGPANKAGKIMLWGLLIIIVLAVRVIIFRKKD